jgi:tripeptidyl-peptidase-1
LTTVGATVLTGSPLSDQERAVTRFPSGGGFSNIYPIPEYQKAAVAGYFQTSPPPYKSYSGSTYGDGVCTYLTISFLTAVHFHILTER